LPNLRSRRDATRVIYEILLQAATGASKTSIIFKVNLSHKLIECYSTFLLKRGLLRLESAIEGNKYVLTDRGVRLLGLLEEVQKELEDFYSMSLASDLVAQRRSLQTRFGFGSERGRVPIEIRRALAF
jgi:predicted transcriptional regulator